MIGQPGVTSRVQDEEVGGVGHQLARLVHEGDGGRRIGPHQGEEHQGEARVWGFTVVGVNPEDLWLNWETEERNDSAL